MNDQDKLITKKQAKDAIRKVCEGKAPIYMGMLLGGIDDIEPVAEVGVQDRVFINHIQRHLLPDQEVVCKICGLTAKEIIRQESPVAEVQDAGNLPPGTVLLKRNDVANLIDEYFIPTTTINRMLITDLCKLPPVLPAEPQDKPFAKSQDKPDYEAMLNELVDDTSKRLKSIREHVASLPVKIQRQIGTMLITPIESRMELINQAIAKHTPRPEERRAKPEKSELKKT